MTPNGIIRDHQGALRSVNLESGSSVRHQARFDQCDRIVYELNGALRIILHCPMGEVVNMEVIRLAGPTSNWLSTSDDIPNPSWLRPGLLLIIPVIGEPIIQKHRRRTNTPAHVPNTWSSHRRLRKQLVRPCAGGKRNAELDALLCVPPQKSDRILQQ